MAEEIMEQAAQLEVEEVNQTDSAAPTIEALQAELEKAKAESRKWEKRAKENKDAASRIAEIEEQNASSQSEIDALKAKANEAIAELEALKESQRRSDIIRQVSKSVGVDESILSRMNGDTEDEITANAVALHESVGNLKRYPNVNDGGGTQAPVVSKESIMSIKNPNERFEAIKQNAQLFRK